MKRIILYLAMALLSLTFVPQQSIGANVEKPAITVTASKPADDAEARVLISRLNEINKMDKSKMSSSEKKEMRKEVKAIKSRLKDVNDRVYISGTAILLFIVLLIVLI